MRKTCENCEFGRGPWSYYDSSGLCTRYPPVINPRAQDGFSFVGTYRDDHCGEFKPKDESEEKRT